MKISNTVKTKERARELVINKTDELRKPEDSVFTEWTTCRCECGETSMFQATIWNKRKTEKIVGCAVCDCCGDDEAPENEVLEIL